MIDYELFNLRESFSRLFVLAVNNKMHLKAFTKALCRSNFINLIQKNRYNEMYDYPLETLFFQITGYKVKDDSYGIYNDAYWCGQNYFDLFFNVKKCFEFIFLKLPFEKMLDLYSIYHEMDFSSLLEYFNKIDKESTILRLLCINDHCSLNDLSIATGISLNTLKKYNSSDELLYKASFSNIAKIIKYFDVSHLLFVKNIMDGETNI